MKKSTLILCFILVFAKTTFAVTDFSSFVNRFPIYEFQDLDSILLLRDNRTVDNQVPINRVTLLYNVLHRHLNDTIPIKLANKVMWEDHRNIKKSTYFRGYKDSDGAPLIFVDESNGLYEPHGGIGTFPEPYVAITDEGQKEDISRLYPIGRITFEKFIMLVLCCEFYDVLVNDIRYELEAYTFSKKDNEMISAISLLSLNGHSNSQVHNTVLRQDTAFICYEFYDDSEEEDPSPNRIQYRTIYKLDEEGYFHRTRPYVRKESWQDVAFINDNDGYVNVRKQSNSKSEVLYRIKNKSLVRVEKLPNTNWGEVLYAKDLFENDEFIAGGHIYLPKLKWYKSIKTHDYNGEGDY